MRKNIYCVSCLKEIITLCECYFQQNCQMPGGGLDHKVDDERHKNLDTSLGKKKK